MTAETIDLVARERDLEHRAIGLGVVRYYDSLKDGVADSQPGVTLIKRMIPPLAAEIEQWVEAARDGRAARNAGLAHFIGQFPAEDVAFITARFVMAGMTGGTKLVPAAEGLARKLEEASMSDELRKADPKGWKRLETKIARCPYPNKRYVLTKNAMGLAKVQRISWSRADRARLGTHLIALCADTCGMFDIEARFVGKNMSVNFIVPRKETLEWLDESNQRCSLNSPWFLPMVVPPVKWTGLNGGGYLDSRQLRRPLIISRGLDRDYYAKLRAQPMPMVFDALNAIQSTPWRINKPVFRVLKAAWDNGSPIGGLPARDVLPLPAAPWGDGDAPDQDSANAHRANLARTHDANERNVSKRLAMQSKLWVAGEFENYDAIYFPHQLDWRGRIYPIPTIVNPQADDSGRAMLEFAAAVPLGEDGAYWLAVHGANTFGFDKVTFNERVEWVEQHQDEIRASACDPFNNRFWTTGSATGHEPSNEAPCSGPFMFLAFCFEWAQLQDWVGAGHAQEDFLSRLPVSWDGSCNGLQNFSAMLRDPVGGAATNLVPSPTPADIYQRVADVASMRVAKDAAAGEVNAVYWLGKVTRKIAKRPTMTLPYGSGKFGFRDQLIDELQKIKADTGAPYLHGDEFLCSMYMANVMHDALGQVVVAAKVAMDWLKEVSRIVAAEGNPLWWTTPAGLLVQQQYREQVGREVECTVGMRRYRLLLQLDSADIDKRKQAQGISPNFVHSLDAAHLMRTVSMCAERGIEDFAMVHDSYGTHAGNATLLRQTLREAFVIQYSGDVLGKLRDELAEQVSEKARATIPPPPPMGSLDLTAVEHSEYFFA